MKKWSETNGKFFSFPFKWTTHCVLSVKTVRVVKPVANVMIVKAVSIV